MAHKRGPKPIGGKTMTPAERQARYRKARKKDVPVTVVRLRRPVDRRSRPQRWSEAVVALVELQSEYQEWLDGLPDNLQGGATAEALEAICAVDLSELETVEPPRGFGRD